MYSFSKTSKDDMKFKTEIVILPCLDWGITKGIYTKYYDTMDIEMQEWETASIYDFLKFEEENN